MDCNHLRLHFKRADVNSTIHYAIKTRAALVEERRRSEVRVARIGGRAARQQRMRKGWATVVLQWAKQRIGINLVARTSQEAATVIAAEIITQRCDCAAAIGVDIGT